MQTVKSATPKSSQEIIIDGAIAIKDLIQMMIALTGDIRPVRSKLASVRSQDKSLMRGRLAGFVSIQM